MDVSLTSHYGGSYGSCAIMEGSRISKDNGISWLLIANCMRGLRAFLLERSGTDYFPWNILEELVGGVKGIRRCKI